MNKKENMEEIEKLKQELDHEKYVISSLKVKLRDHLNLTKAAVLSAVFFPLLIGDIWAWYSQWYYTKTGTEWIRQAFTHDKILCDKGFWSCNMIHDPLTGGLYVFGVTASIVLIIVAYIVCWYCWMEKD
jgi:hypothetical protein